MSLKSRYWLLIIVVHLGLTYLVYGLIEIAQWQFIVGEFLIICTLTFSFFLYRKLFDPLNFIASGKTAISDQDFQVKFLPVGSSEMDELIATYNKMIDNLREERTRNEEQNLFLDKLIEKNPTGIVVLDFDGNVISTNIAAERFLSNIDVNSNEIFNPITFNDQNKKEVELNGIKRYLIERASFIDRGFPRTFFTIQDLTSEILKIEKESYGKVIRMIAHEVNNTIGPVNSIMDTVVEHLAEDVAQSEIKQSLRVAISRNDQLNKFIQNFADYIRLPEVQLERGNICKLATEIGHLMSATLKENDIVFNVQFSKNIIETDFDPILLKQVLINIIKNSLESIEERRAMDGNYKSGEISLVISENPKMIKVIDDGVGIEPNLKDKLFQPFFSTKQNGQGIGLMLIKEILLGHNAKFELATINGTTTFDIEFPE